MNCSALDDPLKGRCRHRFGSLYVGHKRYKITIDKLDQIAAQFVQINITSAQHSDRIRFIQQGQQKVFEGGKFMRPVVGQGQCCVDGLF